jgi:hypothetical protein
VALIDNPISKAIDLGTTFINKFVKDKDLAAKLAHDEEMQQLLAELQIVIGQLEINKAEAGSSSTFVAGWRPAAGWVCVLGMGYNFVLYPFLKLLIVINIPDAPELPILDTGELMTILLGMLGLGVFRTKEKLEGVERKTL